MSGAPPAGATLGSLAFDAPRQFFIADKRAKSTGKLRPLLTLEFHTQPNPEDEAHREALR